MLESDDIHRSYVFTCSDRPSGPAPHEITFSGTKSDKHSVDDFAIERSIVSMRVVLYYDLLRFSFCSDCLSKPKNHPPFSPSSGEKVGGSFGDNPPLLRFVGGAVGGVLPKLLSRFLSPPPVSSTHFAKDE